MVIFHSYVKLPEGIQHHPAVLVVSKHPHWTDPSPGAKLRSALPLLGSEIGFSKVTRALGVQVLPGGLHHGVWLVSYRKATSGR